MTVDVTISVDITRKDIRKILLLALEEAPPAWIDTDPELCSADIADQIFLSRDVTLLSSDGTEYAITAEGFRQAVKAYIEDPGYHGLTEDKYGTICIDIEKFTADGADFILQHAVFGKMKYT